MNDTLSTFRVPQRPWRLALWLGAVAALGPGCTQAPPPGADHGPAPVEPARQVGVPAVPSELAMRPVPAPAPSGSVAEPAEPPKAEAYTGPYFVVTEASTGVYSDPSVSRKGKLGYLRSGSKVPVSTDPIAGADCAHGWLRLRDGGFVCSGAGTTNLSSPEARFSIRAPDVTAVLPYTYARNSKNGTPLYKSVPTLEQMRTYEPYLVKHRRRQRRTSKTRSNHDRQRREERPSRAAVHEGSDGSCSATSRQRLSATHPVEKAAVVAEPTRPEEAHADVAESPDGGAEEAKKPWWQRHDVDKRLNELKLDELASDADAILAKRMVKGFYVAVDREFNWNGRAWYKTTKGLVAPADRMWTTVPSEVHGVELDGEKMALPMGFTYGWQKGRAKYELDATGKVLKPAGTVENHVGIALTGKEMDLGGKKYVEAKDGFWMQKAQLRLTTPGPPPADLAPDERWVDVNLTTQTLVAFEGTRAVYATLISSGKENKVDKDKDHRTPTGEYRIREKHITTTMDGDGTAAGDLPYSIEDVPYVEYFYRAYALHGAFWHSNYGTQMSHGCVNLSPLDAKWVFLFTLPHMPEGWHGVWATPDHPGSRVIVHE